MGGYRDAMAVRVSQNRFRCGIAFGLLLLLAGCSHAGGRGAGDSSPPPPGLFGAPRQAADGGRGAEQGERISGGEVAAEGAAPPSAPELYPGSGRFVGTPQARVGEGADSGTFTLNFAGADVREVVDAVLGRMLGLNYLVDPKVQGTITARTARPLARDQVLPALEDILAVNGAAMVASDGLYRILPLDAARGGGPVLGGLRPRQQGFATHIIPLKFVSADAMQQTLESFLAPGRGLIVDEARNLLLFRGPGVEATDLIHLIDVFDVDWMEGMSFALLPLANANVGDVIVELDTIFGQDGNGPEAMRGVVRFLPIERMNAVLVVSEQPVYLERARDWVARLDRGGGAQGQRQLYVYHLKNARAGEVGEVLGELFDVRTVGESANAGRGEVALGLESGMLIGNTGGGLASGGGRLGGGQSTRPPARGSAASPTPSTSRASRTRRGGGALSGARSRRDLPFAGENGDGPRIIADERNDAMLILATAQEYRMIEATLQRLDVPPLQVLIEATIAEVTLNDALQFGLRWFFDASGQDDTQNITFSDLETGGVNSTFPGFSYLFEGNNARLALNALNEITDVTVVSSPQIMVLDNQTARLQVGDQVPVPVQQAVSTLDPNAPIVNSIQFQDTGVILEVTPHVNASGLVVLDVRQEVSDVVPTTSSGIDAPTIKQRAINSTVAVQTGETIALGGLIRDSRTGTDVGVPVLMHIPLLGNLFKTHSTKNDRTELLVLLTPQVVRDREEARTVTQELRRRLKGLERLRAQFGGEPETEDAATPPDRP
ncbi:MAG: type II secretion system secretin GspD [Rhodothalassiaceae bacterium]